MEFALTVNCIPGTAGDARAERGGEALPTPHAVNGAAPLAAEAVLGSGQ